ncbi:hypothetical protein SAVIM338S_02484 [Streptomyces avidinii]
MDYCIACHRHLNGALACAGCGTPAEYLIPGGPPRPAPVPAPGSGPAALADVYADSLVVLSGGGRTGRAGEKGRAGARRRTAGRRRRRTTLTAGLGFLLAAGAALGLARMAADGERTDRAARVVLTDDAGPEQPAPLPGLTQAPAAPSVLPSGKATKTAKAAAGATKTAGTGTPAGGSQGSAAAPSASASGKAGPGASGQAGTAPPTASGQPAPSTSGTARPPGTPAPPRPTPKPSKTCVFWIFGCS